MSTFSDLLAAANEIEETNLNKNEKIPEVVAAFKKCYDRNPSNDETKRKYLSYFKRQFELEHIKKNQEELRVLGNAQVQQGRYQEAVIIYDASIDLDPSIESAAPIYSNRSLCFFNLGRFQEAEDDGCMAIFLRPEFARGYLRRGNAAMKLEKWKEASEAFEKYFELDPETAKSDPELVQNRNLAKKLFEQNEAEKRRHEKMIEKTRQELITMTDDEERTKKVETLIKIQIGNARMLFFIIEEMLRRDVPFLGSELSLACDRRTAGQVNSKLLRVLLQTNKFDINLSFGARLAPLVSLILGMADCDEMPREAPECLHLLLNWNGVDVNAMSELKMTGNSVVQMTALGFVRHPEVAKILIRYGANVNAVFDDDKGATTNVFDHVVRLPHNPDLEELVRLLIQSGARLLLNGRDKKSSNTMLRILRGVEDQQTENKSFVSEEVLQMMLQLNLHQGLLFRWQSLTYSVDIPFVFIAIQEGAPLRFVELLCAMTPEPMKETGLNKDGELFSYAAALAHRIANALSSFEESMQVLGLLLERGFDLFGVNTLIGEMTAFAEFWDVCVQAKHDLKLLRKTIIDNRGEEEFQRCMKTLK